MWCCHCNEVLPVSFRVRRACPCGQVSQRSVTLVLPGEVTMSLQIGMFVCLCLCVVSPSLSFSLALASSSYLISEGLYSVEEVNIYIYIYIYMYSPHHTHSFVSLPSTINYNKTDNLRKFIEGCSPDVSDATTINVYIVSWVPDGLLKVKPSYRTKETQL